MLVFLAIQSTYNQVQIGLYTPDQKLAIASIDKMVASKECILAIQSLLEGQNLQLKDLSFIATNQGPGPFSTLRVVISTINGLSFATGIPLIGINSLEALMQEYGSLKYPNTVALLNAFGQDIYFGIQKNELPIFGCKNHAQLLQELAQEIPDEHILFVGNGALLYQSVIRQAFGPRAAFIEPFPDVASLDQIAKMAQKSWQEQPSQYYQLQPLYLKKAF